MRKANKKRGGCVTYVTRQKMLCKMRFTLTFHTARKILLRKVVWVKPEFVLKQSEWFMAFHLTNLNANRKRQPPKKVARSLRLNFYFFFHFARLLVWFLFLFLQRARKNSRRKVQTFSSLWRVGYDKLDFFMRKISQHLSLVNIMKAETCRNCRQCLRFFLSLHAPSNKFKKPRNEWKVCLW